MRRRRKPRTGGVAALAAVILLLPLVLANNYWYEVAILVGINAIVCVGLNLLIGYAGQISLGHAGFFGLGAYGSAILSARYGWPPAAALAATTLGVALLALAVGRPILRLKGHYLAMATLGMGIIISIVVTILIRKLEEFPNYTIPAILLISTCLVAWFSQSLLPVPK